MYGIESLWHHFILLYCIIMYPPWMYCEKKYTRTYTQRGNPVRTFNKELRSWVFETETKKATKKILFQLFLLCQKRIIFTLLLVKMLNETSQNEAMVFFFIFSISCERVLRRWRYELIMVFEYLHRREISTDRVQFLFTYSKLSVDSRGGGGGWAPQLKSQKISLWSVTHENFEYLETSL